MDEASRDASHEIEQAAIQPTCAAPSRVIALDGAIVRDEDRIVAVETPVQIVFADIPFAVMMLTPTDLVDFAYGFALTEGMATGPRDVRGVTVEPGNGGLVLRIALVGERLHEHLARQRAMTGRTGCGVCGIDDLRALHRASATAQQAQTISINAVARALSELEARQKLNETTRAVHGAAWADQSGAIRLVREDVGRHNALDKLVGALMRAESDPSEGFVLITSRCSFEMVEKAASFGAKTVVAISAPTSLAIARAEALNVTLIAVARRDTVTVFTNRDLGTQEAK